jgi:serine/threonine-protein kinase
VVVLPEDATVEVDGASVTPNDGTVEIIGQLASIHKVRVKSEGGEVIRDVVVTESGAIPPKVEAPAGSAPKPAASRPLVPRATTTPGSVPPTPPSALPLRQQR